MNGLSPSLAILSSVLVCGIALSERTDSASATSPSTITMVGAGCGPEEDASVCLPGDSQAVGSCDGPVVATDGTRTVRKTMPPIWA